MLDFKADIHCHSNCSDGTDLPIELLYKAKEAGLAGLSITDHDTVAAYTEEVIELAKSLRIGLLAGVELSSEHELNTVHVLGYGFDLASQALLDFLEEMQKRRDERNRLILQKLNGLKMVVSEEELKNTSEGTLGRPHIAALLIKKGYVKTIQEAFSFYLKEGASCYVPGFKFTPLDAIQVIHAAKGKAVLAHPHFIKKRSCLNALLELPFDGIECYYGRLLESEKRPWIKKANQKGWIATGGSDYHGAIRPHVTLGCSWVDEATFNELGPFS